VRPGNATVAAALTCRQYETWKHGPAKPHYARLKAGLKSLQAEGNAGGFPRHHVGAEAHRAGRQGDGRGAAAEALGPEGVLRGAAGEDQGGDNARSASGLGGILLALAPLKSVTGISKKLDRELDRTVGKKR
jgi:hypothetical protein